LIKKGTEKGLMQPNEREREIVWKQLQLSIDHEGDRKTFKADTIAHENTENVLMLVEE
jgi:hypothetical protein